jgi:hypothetical protein
MPYHATTQIDRQEELTRGAMRAVAAVSELPGIEGCATWAAFVRRTPLSPEFRARFEAVRVKPCRIVCGLGVGGK